MQPKLINLDTVKTTEVQWLWYPYIPNKKLTLIQGDPGEGKTTFVLALAALVTKGESMPESDITLPPKSVIYQTAEDGLADTIKPRLELLGADCSRVFVIDESEQSLTLLDERIEQAIKTTEAGLLILDPLQGYLGGEIDMHRSNEVRPVMARLGGVAERTDCAIVIIGHMNKRQGDKGMYRGLGSVDIAAAVRSILVIARDRDIPTTRIMAHLKSSLAPEGSSIAFSLAGERLEWLGTTELTAEEVLNASHTSAADTKEAQAVMAILSLLAEEEKPASAMYEQLSLMGISKRTSENAKKRIGVKSERRGDGWYWTLGGDADC
jgi:RecA-family ATPase